MRDQMKRRDAASARAISTGAQTRSHYATARPFSPWKPRFNANLVQWNLHHPDPQNQKRANCKSSLGSCSVQPRRYCRRERTGLLLPAHAQDCINIWGDAAPKSSSRPSSRISLVSQLSSKHQPPVTLYPKPLRSLCSPVLLPSPFLLSLSLRPLLPSAAGTATLVPSSAATPFKAWVFALIYAKLRF